MNKNPKAEYDYKFDTKNVIVIVRWKDNNVGIMGSNYVHIESLGKVRSWCNIKMQKVDVNIKTVCKLQYPWMGGVKQMDESISLYRVSIIGKTWWWIVFTYLLDMAISNAL